MTVVTVRLLANWRIQAAQLTEKAQSLSELGVELEPADLREVVLLRLREHIAEEAARRGVAPAPRRCVSRAQC